MQRNFVTLTSLRSDFFYLRSWTKNGDLICIILGKFTMCIMSQGHVKIVRCKVYLAKFLGELALLTSPLVHPIIGGFAQLFYEGLFPYASAPSEKYRT